MLLLASRFPVREQMGSDLVGDGCASVVLCTIEVVVKTVEVFVAREVDDGEVMAGTVLLYSGVVNTRATLLDDGVIDSNMLVLGNLETAAESCVVAVPMSRKIVIVDDDVDAAIFDPRTC